MKQNFVEQPINLISKVIFSYSHTHNNFVVGPVVCEEFFVEAMFLETFENNNSFEINPLYRMCKEGNEMKYALMGAGVRIMELM